MPRFAASRAAAAAERHSDLTLAMTVHIIGAGLAGLSTALSLVEGGVAVRLYESAGHAGGRCRSFYDKALGRTIDNGNHLIMSGNAAALDYLRRIGADEPLIGPDEAAYPFVDVKSGRRWVVRIGDGALPTWIFDPKRRVPDTKPVDYVKAAAIALAGPDKSVADVVDRDSVLYRRFWEPLTLAALNTTPERGQARLLWSVIRETFARGGKASRPLIAREGLGSAFIDPAVRRLESGGARIRFNARLRALDIENETVVRLNFPEETIALGEGDEVVLAVPPSRLKQLLPALDPPDDDASILNVHYLTARPVPPLPVAFFVGMLSGDGQWAFVRGDVVSLTVSASHAIGMDETPNEKVVADLWRETQVALGLGAEPYEAVRVIRERRATPDQSPQGACKRLKPRIGVGNLTLAGDHTDTGVPATIEGAIRSGERAANIVLRRIRSRP
jgi:squalene-associated FAD-dependent desaturase